MARLKNGKERILRRFGQDQAPVTGEGGKFFVARVGTLSATPKPGAPPLQVCDLEAISEVAAAHQTRALEAAQAEIARVQGLLSKRFRGRIALKKSDNKS